MPKYVYTARDKKGVVKKGTLEAYTEREAVSRLQGQGLWVTVVTPAHEANAQSSKLVKLHAGSSRRMHSKVTLDDQVLLCQQLATLVEAGVPLLRALEVISAQVESKKLLEALKAVRDDVKAGNSLNEAMAKHPLVFSSLWINLVQTGEVSGHLDETLRQLAKQLEAAQKLQNEARTAMTYPMFLGVTAVGVIALFVYWLIPKFAGMFANMDMELPLLTRIVLAGSDFAKRYVLFIIGSIVVMGWVLKKYLATPRGKETRDRVILSVPLFRDLFAQIYIAEFARGLSTMLDSGVPLLTGLRILGDSSSNKIYAQAIYQVREAVKEGKSLAGPLNETGMFPPITVQMVQVGEEVGELASVVAKLAKYYEERVEVAIARMTRLFEPIAIIILAIIVLVIVLSIFLPIFKMATGGAIA